MDFEFVILDTIAKLHNEFLDTFLPIITSFGNAGIGWIVLSLLLLCIPKYRKAGLTMALALLFLPAYRQSYLKTAGGPYAAL